MLGAVDEQTRDCRISRGAQRRGLQFHAGCTPGCRCRRPGIDRATATTAVATTTVATSTAVSCRSGADAAATGAARADSRAGGERAKYRTDEYRAQLQSRQTEAAYGFASTRTAGGCSVKTAIGRDADGAATTIGFDDHEPGCLTGAGSGAAVAAGAQSP